MVIENLTDEEIEVKEYFDNYLLNCQNCVGDANRQLLRNVFTFAMNAYRGLRGPDGELFMWHPLKVAEIVTEEIGMGTKAAACSLLHHVLQETEYTLADIEHQFGKNIAYILEGLSKVPKQMHNELTARAEDYRNLLLTVSHDLRVTMIKLADRLYHIRNIASGNVPNQQSLATETLEIYAPLAQRLGIYDVKSELEDLSFKILQPQIYNEINQKLLGSEKQRMHAINTFTLPIIEMLDSENMNYAISGRVKTIFSIWNKMQKKKVSFDEIYDIYAIRIIYNAIEGIPEKTQCWHIYNLVTAIYTPKHDRTRDWISSPKENGYEALHVTVMDQNSNWVEVQIRSNRMDEIASHGFAAHWKYKGITLNENPFDGTLYKLKEHKKLQDHDPFAFLDYERTQMVIKYVFVFTNKGELVRMPYNSTVLDFAYLVHTEVGNHCIGAKVNHKSVSPEYVLQSGDRIMILTSEKQTPKENWLDFAISQKARTSIKAVLAKKRRVLILRGKKQLEQLLESKSIRLNNHIFQKFASQLGIRTKDQLYAGIGGGKVTNPALEEILSTRSSQKIIKLWQLRPASAYRKYYNDEKGNPVHINPNKRIADFEFATCCSPLPKDPVAGLLYSYQHMVVHKTTCQVVNQARMQDADSYLPLLWGTQRVNSFLVKLELLGIEHMAVISNLIQLLTQHTNINIRCLHYEADQNNFKVNIDMYVISNAEMNNLLLKISAIKGIRTLKRMQ